MSEWFELVVAYAAFMLSHIIPMFPRLKGYLVQRLGHWLYSVFYAILSLAFMTWVIVAAGRAPYVELLEWSEWQAWVPNVFMPVAIWLAVSGILSPNPLSFGGRHQSRFRPDRPKIVGFVRHPLLWALVLWSSAHAVANPDLAHFLVFGGFSLFAAIGMHVIDRRKQQQMGQTTWLKLSGNRTNFPCFHALHDLRALFPRSVVIWTLLFWISFLHMHTPVMGVPPYPLVPEFLYSILEG